MEMKVLNKKSLLTLAAAGVVASAMAWGLVEGTPGWWKNHEEIWAGYLVNPGDTVDSVFPSASAYPAGDLTLMQALQGGGGPGVNGGARILARAAVCAYLNAHTTGSGIPPGDLVSAVDPAFASGDRGTMIDLAEALDDWNNGHPFVAP